jgi:hypothetical protein
MDVKDLSGVMLDFWSAKALDKIKPVVKRDGDGTERCLVMDPVRGFVQFSPSSDATIAGDHADLRGTIRKKFGPEVSDTIVRV